MISRRGFEAALLLALALAAADATIVATAVPSIARDLGSFALFPWLFSAYLIAQAVTTPLFGRFADVYGRRPMLLAGMLLFIGASAIATVAWSMPALIVARALQGAGAGGIQPLVNTLAGDAYSLEERGRIQARFSGVWATAAIAGPIIGGLFSGYLSWRWIFLVNLPIGLAAVLLLLRSFREAKPERDGSPFDLAGTLLLAAGTTLLVLALLQAGVGWAWGSPQVPALLVASVLVLAAFAWQERRAAAPLLPPWLVSHRVLLGAGLAAAWTGVTMTGITAYVPVFAQGVAGIGPTAAGLVLAAMSAVWPVAAAATPRLYVRFGFRDASVIGGAFCLGGGAVFLGLARSASLVVAAVACALVGIGFGIISTAFIVGIQSIVDWRRRGVVTAANMFTRLLGQALGAALFGAVANTTLVHWFAAAPPTVSASLPANINGVTRVLGGREPHPLAPGTEAYVRGGLELATHRVFIGIGIAAFASVAAVFVVPRRFAPIELGQSGRMSL